MEFRPATPSPPEIEQYLHLFNVCFPKASHYTRSYLRWLYAENPDGHVVGTDAVVDRKIIAHYACVPAQVKIRGSTHRALLSLNTATHPKYQGRGLFTKLATLTYERAAAEGVDLVYGVANQNSIGGFVRKLGFQDVRGLDARISLREPKVDWPKAMTNIQFERVWTPEALRWRCKNPSNSLQVHTVNNESINILGKTGFPLISVTATIAHKGLSEIEASGQRGYLRLTLGLQPDEVKAVWPSFQIPDKLKPSPLRLIYRALGRVPTRIDADAIFFTFLDFDAY